MNTNITFTELATAIRRFFDFNVPGPSISNSEGSLTANKALQARLAVKLSTVNAASCVVPPTTPWSQLSLTNVSNLFTQGKFLSSLSSVDYNNVKAQFLYFACIASQDLSKVTTAIQDSYFSALSAVWVSFCSSLWTAMLTAHGSGQSGLSALMNQGLVSIPSQNANNSSQTIYLASTSENANAVAAAVITMVGVDIFNTMWKLLPLTPMGTKTALDVASVYSSLLSSLGCAAWQTAYQISVGEIGGSAARQVFGLSSNNQPEYNFVGTGPSAVIKGQLVVYASSSKSGYTAIPSYTMPVGPVGGMFNYAQYMAGIWNSSIDLASVVTDIKNACKSAFPNSKL